MHGCLSGQPVLRVCPRPRHTLRAVLLVVHAGIIPSSLAVAGDHPPAQVRPVENGVSVTASDYRRAERFLSWNKEKYVVNADVRHHWIPGQDRLWYARVNQRGEREFIVVDAANGARAPAFDHTGLARALTSATGAAVEPGNLPFEFFRYSNDGSAVEFLVDSQRWECSLRGHGCRTVPTAAVPEIVSPDGKWAAFLRGHDVWLRSTAGGESRALTHDGVQHYSYGRSPGSSTHAVGDVRQGIASPPQVTWSPDSRFLVTHRIDEREVRDLFLVQSVPEDGSVRPKLYTYRYPMPGDEHVPRLEPVVLDVAQRRVVRLRTAPLICSVMPLVEQYHTWWSDDSRTLYYLNRDRYSRALTLYKADPLSGEVSQVLRETTDTTLRTSNDKSTFAEDPAIRTLSNGDLVWFSQRDGWNHLYYYSAKGGLRNQITRGEWVVRSVVRVDEAKRRIYFMASGRESGRDPYQQYLYSAGLDGSDVRLLTPEEGNHDLPAMSGWSTSADFVRSRTEAQRFASSGRYFVDSYSQPHRPPVFVVRSADGRLISRLEQADITKLLAGGYTPPEPFQVLAADGKTFIYGTLFRPSNFDPARSYPVIDSMYPGPQGIRTQKGYTGAVFDVLEAQSLAELGFIVITIDGRGTSYRSKAFADHSYGALAKASDLDDHVAGLRELARRYPYLDLSRVGADGVSAGGYAAARALLTHPDFYKVAVAAEGGHDNRAYISVWGETYIGPFDASAYEAASNLPLVGNLRGKLLLMHGEMDDNVSPALTLKLVNALIAANKDFELLVLPNADHGAFTSRYFIRRKWDYFVRLLMGREPPANYAIQ
jgi:dipeptidyl-peptidase 4